MAPMPTGAPARVDDPAIAHSMLAGEGSPAAAALPAEPVSEYYGPTEGKEYPSWILIGAVFAVLLALVVFFILR